MYEYNATVLRVYDGDTIRVDLDLGFGICLTDQSIRLLGIDAFEIRGKDKIKAIPAKDRLTDLLARSGGKCTIKTKKDKERGKFGRILGEIFVRGEERSLNQVLLDEGLVEIY